MFNTWKYNSDSYVVLPTGPPFDRRRNGGPRRLACDPCRARKLRCTSEATGCFNCQRRGLICQYGIEGETSCDNGAARVQRRRGTSSESKPLSATRLPPGDGKGSRRPSSSDTCESNILEGLEVDTTAGTDWSGFEPPSIDPFHPPSCSLGTVPLPGQPDAANDQTLNLFHLHTTEKESTRDMPARNPDAFPPYESALGHFTTTEATEPDATELTPESIGGLLYSEIYRPCSCYTTPLKAWELFITEAFSKNTTGQDLAQSQQAALSSCEALVCCHVCSSQSQNVLLLIDISKKLLDSLKVQDGELPTGNSDASDGSSRGDTRSSWTERMLRLGRLVASISTLLEGEQRLAHRKLIQNVQMQFTNLMFGWQNWETRDLAAE